MTKWGRFLGVFGLVIFAFGVLGSFMVGSFLEPLMLAHWAPGVVFLLIWLILSGGGSFSDAGAVVGGRTARFAYYAVISAVLFSAILVALNWMANRHDKRWDLTEAGVYSLSEQSVQTIQGLKKPLKLVMFTNPALDQVDRSAQLLDLYRYYNPGKVSIEIVDPRTKPHLIKKYEMKEGNTVYIEYGEPSTDENVISTGVSRLNEASEQAITNSVIKLTRGAARKIYYLTGHDEPDLDSVGPNGFKDFVTSLGNEHLTIENFLLAEKGTVPADAAAIVVAAPKKPMLPQEKEALITYAKQGGSLFLLTDPRGSEDVRQIAAAFGISVGNDVVLDQVQRLFAAPTLGAQPVVREYGPHAITRSLNARTITIFTLSSSVSKSSDSDPSATYTDLAKTSPTAWAETNLVELLDAEEPTATLDTSDKTGPVSLALVYEKKVQPAANTAPTAGTDTNGIQKMSRVVVFGDSDWLANEGVKAFSNRDLAMNAMNWLSGEEGGISIRPRTMRAASEPLFEDSITMLLATSFVVPELILLLGLAIWWNRRTMAA